MAPMKGVNLHALVLLNALLKGLIGFYFLATPSKIGFIYEKYHFEKTLVEPPLKRS
jgi:hypothetical protein